MHLITYTNVAAGTLAVAIVGFIIAWVTGTIAAHKQGGKPWFTAALHVLCFLLFWPWAYFAGWLWWFIVYGFTSGFGAADGRVRRE